MVLAGLGAVGATDAQAASGLMALCVTQAIAMIYLSWRYRMPLTIAWSTPGAALLATQGYVDGGWPAAVGAFLVTGVLIIACGLLRPLARLVAAIPPRSRRPCSRASCCRCASRPSSPSSTSRGSSAGSWPSGSC
ncbi:benzoate/H(+) symporter BenE family transporter [Demequina litorisediminis]|uniref:benzoate/H(+) symporter BenE family transporter n=1 Tax=Demequina litorisediminis TaxID=1849022 RepID=UPI0032B0130F